MADAKHDPVNHPKHYTFGKLEVITVLDDWQLGFSLGNAVKYIARAGRKDPTKYVEDLEKAAWYLNHEIERAKRLEGLLPDTPEAVAGYEAASKLDLRNAGVDVVFRDSLGPVERKKYDKGYKDGLVGGVDKAASFDRCYAAGYSDAVKHREEAK